MRSRNLDILLKNKRSQPRGIIEAKKGNQNLETHKEQLYNYVSDIEVKLGVLTNGIEWWFFLPKYRNEWRFKKFCVLDIYNSSPEEVCKKFIKFLNINKVYSPDYAIRSRKCVGKLCEDVSLMGISNEELFTRYNCLKNDSSKTIAERNRCLIELEFEAT